MAKMFLYAKAYRPNGSTGHTGYDALITDPSWDNAEIITKISEHIDRHDHWKPAIFSHPEGTFVAFNGATENVLGADHKYSREQTGRGRATRYMLGYLFGPSESIPDISDFKNSLPSDLEDLLDAYDARGAHSAELAVPITGTRTDSWRERFDTPTEKFSKPTSPRQAQKKTTWVRELVSKHPKTRPLSKDLTSIR